MGYLQAKSQRIYRLVALPLSRALRGAMKKVKNIFSHIWSPGDGIQNWETYLLELNVRRIPCVAFIIVIFQIANFVIKETAGEVLPLWEFLPFIVFAAVYGLTALLIPYRIINRPQLARAFYLSFWVLLYVGYIPFFVRDIISGLQYTNVLLFFSGLIIVPVFSVKERAVLTTLFAAATIALAFIYDAPARYMVFLVLLGVSVFLLSYVVQVRSLSSLRRLLYEAYCDVLTGVLNRRGGLNLMKLALDTAKAHLDTLAFFMVDIDFFKNVNDAYGHRKGDEVLVMVANMLKVIFNEPSDIICRIGGEEFSVCARVRDQAEAERYAESLLRKIEDRKIPTPRQDASTYLTVSIGVRLYKPERPEESIDELSLIDDADTALYRAKGSGRNRYEIYKP